MKHATEGRQRTLRTLTQMLTQTQMWTTQKRRFKRSKALFQTVSWLQISDIDNRSRRHYASRKQGKRRYHCGPDPEVQ